MSERNGTTTSTRRKTLASQIDRLDTILDGFSVGLQEAVAEAVRQAVHQTLQSLITEVATNPAVLTGIREMLVPSPQSTAPATESVQPDRKPQQVPSWRSRLWTWSVTTAMSQWSACVRMGRTAWRYCKIGWTYRRSVLCLSSVGLIVGLGSYLLSPVFAAVMAGIGGMGLALLIIAGLALKQVLTSPFGID